MLEIAQLHESELKEKFHHTWFKDKYKYYYADTFCSEFKVEPDTWNKHQFVSLYHNDYDPEDIEVIGYIEYDINRRTNNVHSLAAINFSDYKTFGVDLGRAVCDIFEKFKFNKLNFSVVVGNPIEQSYDKLVEKYGGRIVGYFEKEVKLIDGKYCDEKLYEITAENYFKSKENNYEKMFDMSV